MTNNSEALDIIESKIRELEVRVYGEKSPPSENFNPVMESLMQANTLISAALSGREKFTSIHKRLNELNDHLDVHPLSEDPRSVEAKLDIILSMEKELDQGLCSLEEVNQLKGVLDEEAIKNTQSLKTELTRLADNQTAKKEKLCVVNGEVVEVLGKFNEVCLEISRSFVLLNEAITKLEKENQPKKPRDE